VIIGVLVDETVRLSIKE